jgi:hypothetical protein
MGAGHNTGTEPVAGLHSEKQADHISQVSSSYQYILSLTDNQCVKLGWTQLFYRAKQTIIYIANKISVAAQAKTIDFIFLTIYVQLWLVANIQSYIYDY